MCWCGMALMFYWFAAHLETASLAMWISAWDRGVPAYAAVQALRTPLVIPFWMGHFSLRALIGGVRGADSGWVLPLIILIPAAFGSFARRRAIREKLSKELKWIAAAAIPSRNDKRFKSWNPQAIYAPGRWGETRTSPRRTPQTSAPRSQRHSRPTAAMMGPQFLHELREDFQGHLFARRPLHASAGLGCTSINSASAPHCHGPLAHCFHEVRTAPLP